MSPASGARDTALLLLRRRPVVFRDDLVLYWPVSWHGLALAVQELDMAPTPAPTAPPGDAALKRRAAPVPLIALEARGQRNWDLRYPDFEPGAVTEEAEAEFAPAAELVTAPAPAEEPVREAVVEVIVEPPQFELLERRWRFWPRGEKGRRS